MKHSADAKLRGTEIGRRQAAAARRSVHHHQQQEQQQQEQEVGHFPPYSLARAGPLATELHGLTIIDNSKRRWTRTVSSEI